jgi:hypothetical protein
MSHLCKLKTEWKRLEHIKAMCETLGYTLNTGGHVRTYYSQKGELCDYTIEFNDPKISKTYNAGLKKNSKGYYDLLMDNSIHGSIITDTSVQKDGKVRTGGKTTDIRKGMQLEYTTNVIRSVAKRKGFRFQKQKNKTAAGYTKIKLTV